MCFAQGFPGKKTSWNGYDRYDFTIDGRATRVVVPKKAAIGNPWVMRARFPDVCTEMDVQLLAKGYHIAYMDVVKMFGNQTAVRHWDAFYLVMTKKYGMNKKVVLEGLSRGGLMIHNWGALNPEKVKCIVGLLPVCDIKSWPAGTGVGVGNKEEWQILLAAYGMSEKQALAYDKNPIDTLAPLAAAGVPILHVAGDADVHVPLVENSQVVYDRYTALGGKMKLMVIKGGDHLTTWSKTTPEDHAAIVEFITAPEPGTLSLDANYSRIFATPTSFTWCWLKSNYWNLKS